MWYVLTPDLDLYPEDWSLTGGDGPSKIKLKGTDFVWWSRVGGSSYRFAKPVADDQQLRSYIKQAFRDGLKLALTLPGGLPMLWMERELCKRQVSS